MKVIELHIYILSCMYINIHTGSKYCKKKYLEGMWPGV